MFDFFEEPIVPSGWVLPPSMKPTDTYAEQVSGSVGDVEQPKGYGDGKNNNWGTEHPLTQFHLRSTLSTAKGGAVR